MAEMNIDALIAAASKGLKIPPEALRLMLKNGDISGITANMSEKDRAKVEQVLKDPKLAEKFKKQYTGKG